MSEAPELTTRDVFAQIDRRLARLEDDFRELRRYVEERLHGMQGHFEARFTALEARISALEAKVDRNFRWLVGILLAGWLSMMTTLLLK